MDGGGKRVHGIVLAGAHAWGESVLERVCPRPLLPVAGRPLIWFALDWVRGSGISNVTVCANSDTEALRSCLGNGESVGLSLDYYEDVMPRGPAGCTRDAAYRELADVFLVVEGSILPQIDLPAVLEEHRRSRAALTIVATESAAGGGQRGTLEPTGVYVASRSALEMVPAKGYQDIKEMWIPRLYQHGCPAAPYLVGEEDSLRVNGVGSYLTASARAIEALANRGVLGGDYWQAGTAWLHRSAQVADTARFSGHVLVGPGVKIEHNAAVLGPSVIGPDSRIGASAVVSHVVAWAECQIGRGVILNRCILLNGSQVEPGLVVRDTVWCGETLSSPLLGDRSSYWALHRCGASDRAAAPATAACAAAGAEPAEATVGPSLGPERTAAGGHG